MKRMIYILAATAALSCGSSRPATDRLYTNPVLNQDWPDPTVWEADGTYYTVATGVSTIFSSKDLVNWTDLKKAPLSPEAMEVAKSMGRMFWAPDVVKIGDTYMLYLTCYNADVDSRIVAFSSAAPDGPFEFVGKITDSKETGIKDTIDPEVVVDPATGKTWLFFGSVGKGHRVQLLDDGTAVAPGAEYVHVSGIDINDDSSRSRVFEGAYLHFHKGYWYLFVSSGHYGDGSYSIKVGRSRTLEGEFLDRDGRRMTDGYATVILSSPEGARFAGPGHNGEIFTDRKGNDFMLYHCHDLESGSKRARYMFLQQIFWDRQGWPYFKPGSPVHSGLKPQL